MILVNYDPLDAACSQTHTRKILLRMLVDSDPPLVNSVSHDPIPDTTALVTYPISPIVMSKIVKIPHAPKMRFPRRYL